MSAKLEQQLLQALLDVMSEDRFRILSEATALQVGVDAADMWRDRLRELEDEDDLPDDYEV
jgi:hypothetical protein